MAVGLVRAAALAAALRRRRWRGGAAALGAAAARALWRGSCNSLCDEKAGGCSWPKDRALLSRAALLHAASRCPAKTDVGLTASHHNCPRSFSRVTGPLPLAQWSRYAYLLHVDGNGFSGRLEELLTLGGVILKQQSPFDAWYYPLLQPGTHYAPFSLTGANASGVPELCDALRALHADAARAERLAAAARNFTAAYLAPERVRYYVAALLRRYASLQRFTPRRHPLAVPFDAAEAPRSASNATARLVGCPPGDAKCCRRHPRRAVYLDQKKLGFRATSGESGRAATAPTARRGATRASPARCSPGRRAALCARTRRRRCCRRAAARAATP